MPSLVSLMLHLPYFFFFGNVGGLGRGPGIFDTGFCFCSGFAFGKTGGGCGPKPKPGGYGDLVFRAMSIGGSFLGVVGRGGLAGGFGPFGRGTDLAIVISL